MKVFSIAEKLLTLRDRIQVFDQAGALAYEAVWSGGWLASSYVITKDDVEVATMQRQWFSLAPAWDATIGSAGFELRRSFFSLRRQTSAIGGPFDKAVMTGSLLDFSFELTRFGRVIANAKAEAISLRDRIGIHLLLDDPASELFAILMMVNLMIQRESRGGDDDSASGMIFDLLGQVWRRNR